GVLLLQPGPGDRPRRLRLLAPAPAPEQRAGEGGGSLDRPVIAQARGSRLTGVTDEVTPCIRSRSPSLPTPAASSSVRSLSITRWSQTATRRCAPGSRPRRRVTRRRCTFIP